MRSKIFLAIFIYTLIGALLFMQTGAVLASTDNPLNPITSAITNFINDDPTPVPSSTPTPTPSTEPITTPIINPEPSSEPITAPVIVEPTPTPAPSNNNSSQSSSGSSSNGGNHEAPVCGDSKPVSAPRLLSALPTGKNQITLVWSKASDPVSYYLVAYGTKSNHLEYGNPNLGDKNTTSYTVNGLSNGKTYYFKVRAGNGCMPGGFSNELSAKVSGKNITGPAIGFKAGVLGSAKKVTSSQPEAEFKPITEAKPIRIINSSTTLFEKLSDFFTNLFRK